MNKGQLVNLLRENKISEFNRYRKNNPNKFIDLGDTDLSDLYLRKVNFSFVNLKYSYLCGADLSEASLYNANLAETNLYNANLAETFLKYTNFKDANLKGANLRWAFISGANLKGTQIDYQLEEGLLEKVYRKISSNPDILDMRVWHSSDDTKHCIGGLGIRLSNKGKYLEDNYGSDIAALLLLGHEVHDYFDCTEEEVMEWLNTKFKKI